MWLFYALLAPLFFGIVHVLDAYCVEEIFDKPWMGSVVGAVTTILVVFVPLPFFLPLIEIKPPHINVIILAITTGILVQISQILYFQSLSYSEAGIVAAYWNMIPGIIVVLSFFILGNILSASHIVGIITLVVASTIMLLVDTNFDARAKTFFLMLFASLLQAIAYIINDWVFTQTSFSIAFILFCLGLVVAGLIPLLIPKIRRMVNNNSINILAYGNVLIAIEILNILALFCAQFAISLGNPALVAAAETTIPAFAFVISILLIITIGKIGDRRSFYRLPTKLAAILAMVIGVYLIS